MKSLQTQFFKLSPPLRIAVGVLLLAAIVFGAYNLVILPKMKSYATLKGTFDNLKTVNTAKMNRLNNLRSTNPTLAITESQMAALAQSGNTAISSAELPEIIESIKDAAVNYGAKDVSMTEGSPVKKLVRLDNNAGMFTASALPLELTFQSDYRKISEFLFNLHGKRLFIGIPDVQMETDNYTSAINAKITLELYYREEI